MITELFGVVQPEHWTQHHYGEARHQELMGWCGPDARFQPRENPPCIYCGHLFTRDVTPDHAPPNERWYRCADCHRRFAVRFIPSSDESDAFSMRALNETSPCLGSELKAQQPARAGGVTNGSLMDSQRQNRAPTVATARRAGIR
jgi:hypothetical protein